jgi:preprotein translocase subunit YajC
VNYWPYVVLLVLLAVMLMISQRNRRRQASQAEALASKIGFGTEVMTTSGLYGTVVARNEDDTVQLAIAPGVEVKWAVAALRDVASLPPRYRKGASGPSDTMDDDVRGHGEGPTGSGGTAPGDGPMS